MGALAERLAAAAANQQLPAPVQQQPQERWTSAIPNERTGTGLLGFIGNMGADMRDIALGLSRLGGMAAGDILRDIPTGRWSDVDVVKPSFAWDLVKGFGKDIVDRYGNPAEIPSEMYQHPLSFVADALTLAGGAGAVARGSAGIGRYGQIARGLNLTDEAAQLAKAEAVMGLRATRSALADAQIPRTATLAEDASKLSQVRAGLLDMLQGRQMPPRAAAPGMKGPLLADGSFTSVAATARAAEELSAVVKATPTATRVLDRLLPAGNHWIPRHQSIFGEQYRRPGFDWIETRTAEGTSGYTRGLWGSRNPLVQAVWTNPIQRRILTQSRARMGEELHRLERLAAYGEKVNPYDIEKMRAAMARMESGQAERVARFQLYGDALVATDIDRWTGRLLSEGLIKRRNQLEQMKALAANVTNKETFSKVVQGMADQGHLAMLADDLLGAALEAKGYTGPAAYERAVRDVLYDTEAGAVFTVDEKNTLIAKVLSGDIELDEMYRLNDKPGWMPDQMPERARFREQLRAAGDMVGMPQSQQDFYVNMLDHLAQGLVDDELANPGSVAALARRGGDQGDPQALIERFAAEHGVDLAEAAKRSTLNAKKGPGAETAVSTALGHLRDGNVAEAVRILDTFENVNGGTMGGTRWADELASAGAPAGPPTADDIYRLITPEFRDKWVEGIENSLQQRAGRLYRGAIRYDADGRPRVDAARLARWFWRGVEDNPNAVNWYHNGSNIAAELTDGMTTTFRRADGSAETVNDYEILLDLMASHSQGTSISRNFAEAWEVYERFKTGRIAFELDQATRKLRAYDPETGDNLPLFSGKRSHQEKLKIDYEILHGHLVRHWEDEIANKAVQGMPLEEVLKRFEHRTDKMRKGMGLDHRQKVRAFAANLKLDGDRATIDRRMGIFFGTFTGETQRAAANAEGVPRFVRTSIDDAEYRKMEGWLRQVQQQINRHLPAGHAPYALAQVQSVLWGQAVAFAKSEAAKVRRLLNKGVDFDGSDLKGDALLAMQEYERMLRAAVTSEGSDASDYLDAWQALADGPMGWKVQQEIKARFGQSTVQLAQNITDVVKGQIIFGDDFQSIIQVFGEGDFTTLTHEGGHLMQRLIPDEVAGRLWESYRASVHGDAPIPDDGGRPLTQTIRSGMSGHKLGDEDYASVDTARGEIHEGMYVTVGKAYDGPLPQRPRPARAKAVPTEYDLAAVPRVLRMYRRGDNFFADLDNGKKGVSVDDLYPVEALHPYQLGVSDPLGVRPADQKTTLPPGLTRAAPPYRTSGGGAHYEKYHGTNGTLERGKDGVTEIFIPVRVEYQRGAAWQNPEAWVLQNGEYRRAREVAGDPVPQVEPPSTRDLTPREAVDLSQLDLPETGSLHYTHGEDDYARALLKWSFPEWDEEQAATFGKARTIGETEGYLLVHQDGPQRDVYYVINKQALASHDRKNLYPEDYVPGPKKPKAPDAPRWTKPKAPNATKARKMTQGLRRAQREGDVREGEAARKPDLRAVPEPEPSAPEPPFEKVEPLTRGGDWTTIEAQVVSGRFDARGNPGVFPRNTKMAGQESRIMGILYRHLNKRDDWTRKLLRGEVAARDLNEVIRGALAGADGPEVKAVKTGLRINGPQGAYILTWNQIKKILADDTNREILREAVMDPKALRAAADDIDRADWERGKALSQDYERAIAEVEAGVKRERDVQAESGTERAMRAAQERSEAVSRRKGQVVGDENYTPGTVVEAARAQARAELGENATGRMVDERTQQILIKQQKEAAASAENVEAFGEADLAPMVAEYAIDGEDAFRGLGLSEAEKDWIRQEYRRRHPEGAEKPATPEVEAARAYVQETGDEFIYHGTSRANAERINEEGVTTHETRGTALSEEEFELLDEPFMNDASYWGSRERAAQHGDVLIKARVADLERQIFDVTEDQGDWDFVITGDIPRDLIEIEGSARPPAPDGVTSRARANARSGYLPEGDWLPMVIRRQDEGGVTLAFGGDGIPVTMMSDSTRVVASEAAIRGLMKRAGVTDVDDPELLPKLYAYLNSKKGSGTEAIIFANVEKSKTMRHLFDHDQAWFPNDEDAASKLGPAGRAGVNEGDVDAEFIRMKEATEYGQDTDTAAFQAEQVVNLSALRNPRRRMNDEQLAELDEKAQILQGTPGFDEDELAREILRRDAEADAIEAEDAAAAVREGPGVQAEAPGEAPPPSGPPSGAPPTGGGGNYRPWSVAMSEAFAEDFERWVYNQLLPRDVDTHPAFRQLQNALRSLWQSVRGYTMERELVPEVSAQAFDRYFGGAFTEAAAPTDPRWAKRLNRRVRALANVSPVVHPALDQVVEQAPGDATALMHMARQARTPLRRKLAEVFNRNEFETSFKDPVRLGEKLNDGVPALDALQARVIVDNWTKVEEAIGKVEAAGLRIARVEDSRGAPADDLGTRGVRLYVEDPDVPGFISEIEIGTPFYRKHRNATSVHERMARRLPIRIAKLDNQLNAVADEIARITDEADPANQRLLASLMKQQDEILEARAVAEDQYRAFIPILQALNEGLVDEIDLHHGGAQVGGPDRQAIRDLRLWVAEHIEADMLRSGYGDSRYLFDRIWYPIRKKAGAEFVKNEANPLGTWEGGGDPFQLDQDFAMKGLPQPIYFPHMKPPPKLSDFITQRGRGMIGARKLAQNKNLKRWYGELMVEDAFGEPGYLTDFELAYQLRAARAIKMADTNRLVDWVVRNFGREIPNPESVGAGEVLYAPDFLNAMFRTVITLEDQMGTLLANLPAKMMSGAEFTKKEGREAAGRIIAEGLKSEGIMEVQAGALLEAIENTFPEAQRELVAITRRGVKYYAVPKVVAKRLEASAGVGYGAGNKALRLFWDSPTNLWRAMVLYGRPAWVANNFFGNLLFLKLQGGRVSDIIRQRFDPEFKDMLQEMAKEIPGAEIGFFTSMSEQYTPAFGSAAEGGIGAAQVAAKNAARQATALKPAYKYGDFMKSLNEDIENYARRAGMLRAVETEIDPEHLRTLGRRFWADKKEMERVLVDGIPEDAVERILDRVNTFFGDFSRMSPAGRHIVRRFLFPFWGFYRHVIKLFLQLPSEYPGRFTILRAIESTTDEMQAEYGPLPEWMGGMATFGGDINQEGDTRFMSMAGPNPLNVLSDDVVSMLHPALKFGLERATGRDAFTGRPFSSPDVVTPYGSDQSFEIIRDAEGKPIDAKAVGKVVPPLGVHALSQIPQYDLIKNLLAGGRGYDTEGILSSIMGGPVIDSQGQVVRPVGALETLGKYFGFSTFPFDVPSYQERLGGDREKALSYALRKWQAQQGAEG